MVSVGMGIVGMGGVDRDGERMGDGGSSDRGVRGRGSARAGRSLVGGVGRVHFDIHVVRIKCGRILVLLGARVREIAVGWLLRCLRLRRLLILWVGLHGVWPWGGEWLGVEGEGNLRGRTVYIVYNDDVDNFEMFKKSMEVVEMYATTCVISTKIPLVQTAESVEECARALLIVNRGRELLEVRVIYVHKVGRAIREEMRAKRGRSPRDGRT